MALTQLPPEARLLLDAACAPRPRAWWTEDAAARLDWGLLHRLAEREQAGPPLWAFLQAGGTRLPEASSNLHALARVTSFRMAYLEQRLDATVAALTSAGITPVLLKGAAMATGPYAARGGFVARPMLDLDVLVPADRAQDALVAALAAGWRRAAGAERSAGLHHLPALVDATGIAVCLELHTDVIAPGHPFAGYAERMVASAVPRIGRVGAPLAPDAPHLLLHACIHLAWSHLLRQGAWRTFRDATVLIESGEIEWGAFIELARAVRAESCCYWTLRLGRNLAGVPVPPEVLAALRPRMPAWRLELVERHLTLVLLPTVADCPSVALRRRMWSAAIQPARSGHGAARPWRVPEDRAAALAAAPPERVAGSRAAATQRAAAATWLRYGRGLLGSSVG